MLTDLTTASIALALFRNPVWILWSLSPTLEEPATKSQWLDLLYRLGKYSSPTSIVVLMRVTPSLPLARHRIMERLNSPCYGNDMQFLFPLGIPIQCRRMLDMCHENWIWLRRRRKTRIITTLICKMIQIRGYKKIQLIALPKLNLSPFPS